MSEEMLKQQRLITELEEEFDEEQGEEEPTPKQMKFIENLMKTKEGGEKIQSKYTPLTKKNASLMIEELKKLPDKREEEKEEIKFDLDTIKRYIAPENANDTEIRIFYEICKERKANPFLNEAFLIKYGNEPAKIVLSKDFFLKKARMCKDYRGFKAGIIVKKRGDGMIERREGCFIDKDNEELMGGWAKVFIDEKEPVYEELALRSYIKYDKEGKPLKFWNQMPEVMIRKTALTLALREAFAEELGGVYSIDELE